MQDVFDKIIEGLKEKSFVDYEEYYKDGGECLMSISDAIEIVNQVAEEYCKPKLTPEQREACWAHSSKDCSKCGQCYVPEINVGENEEFCEWRNNGIADEWNPSCEKGTYNVFGVAWFKRCPYCGKEIKVVE